MANHYKGKMIDSLTSTMERNWSADLKLPLSSTLNGEQRAKPQGSLSGLLRRASLLCVDGGVVDPRQKSLVKDLVLINDPKMRHALEKSDSDNGETLREYLASVEDQQRSAPMMMHSSPTGNSTNVEAKTDEMMKTWRLAMSRFKDAQDALASTTSSTDNNERPEDDNARDGSDSASRFKRNRPQSMHKLVSFRQPNRIKMESTPSKLRMSSSSSSSPTEPNSATVNNQNKTINNSAATQLPSSPSSNLNQNYVDRSLQLALQMQQQQIQLNAATNNNNANVSPQMMGLQPDLFSTAASIQQLQAALQLQQQQHQQSLTGFSGLNGMGGGGLGNMGMTGMNTLSALGALGLNLGNVGGGSGGGGFGGFGGLGGMNGAGNMGGFSHLPGMNSTMGLGSAGLHNTGLNTDTATTAAAAAAAAATTDTPVVPPPMNAKEKLKKQRLEARREKKSLRERQRRLVLNNLYDKIGSLLFENNEHETKDRASILQSMIAHMNKNCGVPLPKGIKEDDTLDAEELGTGEFCVETGCTHSAVSSTDFCAQHGGNNQKLSGLTSKEKLARRRGKKSLREKQRRHNVNVLSERIGDMLDVTEIKDKTTVLTAAIAFLAEHPAIDLVALPQAKVVNASGVGGSSSSSSSNGGMLPPAERLKRESSELAAALLEMAGVRK